MKSLYRIPWTNIMLYIDYIAIKWKKVKTKILFYNALFLFITYIIKCLYPNKYTNTKNMDSLSLLTASIYKMPSLGEAFWRTPNR